MINWQIIGQLLATGVIMLSGPAVIVLLALKKEFSSWKDMLCVNLEFKELLVYSFSMSLSVSFGAISLEYWSLNLSKEKF